MADGPCGDHVTSMALDIDRPMPPPDRARVLPMTGRRQGAGSRQVDVICRIFMLFCQSRPMPRWECHNGSRATNQQSVTAQRVTTARRLKYTTNINLLLTSDKQDRMNVRQASSARSRRRCPDEAGARSRPGRHVDAVPSARADRRVRCLFRGGGYGQQSRFRPVPARTDRRRPRPGGGVRRRP